MGVLRRSVELVLTEEEWLELERLRGVVAERVWLEEKQRHQALDGGWLSLSAAVSSLVVLGMGALARARVLSASLAGAEGPLSPG